MDSAAISGLRHGASSHVGTGVQAAAPSQHDIHHFQQLVSQGGSSTGAQPAVSGTSHSASSASGVSATSGVPESNLSNGMKDGIKQAAEAYRSRFESLKDGLKKVEKTNSISGLLAWQLDSVKMGVEMEFTGKIASKLVQDIEQLTKQQG